MTEQGFSYNTRIHRRLTLGIQAVLFLGLVLSVIQGSWLNSVVVLGIILLTLLPLATKRRFDVFIPPEFELVAVLFVFLTLFLGEVHGYYLRFPWWDKVLLTGSGVLLGILGFLLVYVLNEDEDVDLHLDPRFVAVFALAFSVALGAVWEILEFSLDSMFGLNMQKSGLVDTMWDLIVDTIGALSISVFGYFFLKSETDSFLERWIEGFVRANPGLFKRTRTRH
jgi:hypothetical protein